MAARAAGARASFKEWRAARAAGAKADFEEWRAKQNAEADAVVLSAGQGREGAL